MPTCNIITSRSPIAIYLFIALSVCRWTVALLQYPDTGSIYTSARYPDSPPPMGMGSAPIRAAPTDCAVINLSTFRHQLRGRIRTVDFLPYTHYIQIIGTFSWLGLLLNVHVVVEYAIAIGMAQWLSIYNTAWTLSLNPDRRPFCEQIFSPDSWNSQDIASHSILMNTTIIYLYLQVDMASELITRPEIIPRICICLPHRMPSYILIEAMLASPSPTV
jgi:hypothetical protein